MVWRRTRTRVHGALRRCSCSQTLPCLVPTPARVPSSLFRRAHARTAPHILSLSPLLRHGGHADRSYYNMHAAPCGTYESVMTRGFLHGRTEVARSCSAESLAWCEAMQSRDGADAPSQLELLKVATVKHVGTCKKAAAASGCDRHLLGLRLVSTPEEQALQDYRIFADPVFSQSGTWKLSTSHLASEFFDGWGYVDLSTSYPPLVRLTVRCRDGAAGSPLSLALALSLSPSLSLSRALSRARSLSRQVWRGGRGRVRLRVQRAWGAHSVQHHVEGDEERALCAPR